MPPSLKVRNWGKEEDATFASTSSVSLKISPVSPGGTAVRKAGSWKQLYLGQESIRDMLQNLHQEEWHVLCQFTLVIPCSPVVICLIADPSSVFVGHEPQPGIRDRFWESLGNISMIPKSQSFNTTVVFSIFCLCFIICVCKSLSLCYRRLCRSLSL